MTISVVWKGATTGSVDILPGQSFALGAVGSPDAFAFASGKDGLSLVLANGLVDPANPSKSRGPLTGSVLVSYGGETRLPLTPVVIHDGCGKVLRLGKVVNPGLPAKVWDDWWLREWYGIAAADRDKILTRLATHDYTLDETKFAAAPDQPLASTQRCCQYAWSGTIAACLGVATDKVRDAALAWTDAQFNRPCLYYTADGALLSRPDVWIGEQGFRKGYHGKWARTTGSTWRNPDAAHRAIHRGLTAAIAFGDPVALLWCRSMLNAILSEPSVAFVLSSGEARAFGYTLEALALFYKFVEPSQRVLQAMARVVQSVRGSMGYAPNGNAYALMWPVEKIHGETHVHPAVADCERYAKAHGWDASAFNPTTLSDWLQWFKAQAVEDELPMETYTTAPGGVQWYLQGAAIWGLAIAYRGAKTADDLTQLTGTKLLDALASIVVGQGAGTGIGEDGKPFAPLPLHDSVAPRSGRAKQANIPHGGTLLFCIDPLRSMGDKGKAIAKGLYQHASMKLSDPALGAIQIAGLGAIREWGIR